MNTKLNQNHVTFTIPVTLSHILFERKYQPEQMISLAANVFRNILLSSAKLKGKEFQPGILAIFHKSGNGLNANHLVKQNILTVEESAALNSKYENGFHVSGCFE